RRHTRSTRDWSSDVCSSDLVSVVIPTWNEAASIGLVLADIPAADVAEVVVVDSDSTDGTPEIATRAGARVVREPRRGYGRACLKIGRASCRASGWSGRGGDR